MAVSYEEVAAACERLRTEGVTPATRPVRRMTGGAAKTVNDFVREWRAADAAARERATELSPACVTALRAEISRRVETALQESRRELAAERDATDYVAELLEGSQTAVERTLRAAEEERVVAAQRVRELELEVSARQERVQADQDLIRVLQTQVSEARRENVLLQREVQETRRASSELERQFSIAESLVADSKARSLEMQGRLTQAAEEIARLSERVAAEERRSNGLEHKVEETLLELRAVAEKGAVAQERVAIAEARAERLAERCVGLDR